MTSRLRRRGADRRVSPVSGREGKKKGARAERLGGVLASPDFTVLVADGSDDCERPGGGGAGISGERGAACRGV